MQSKAWLWPLLSFHVHISVCGLIELYTCSAATNQSCVHWVDTMLPKLQLCRHAIHQLSIKTACKVGTRFQHFITRVQADDEWTHFYKAYPCTTLMVPVWPSWNCVLPIFFRGGAIPNKSLLGLLLPANTHHMFRKDTFRGVDEIGCKKATSAKQMLLPWRQPINKLL